MKFNIKLGPEPLARKKDPADRQSEKKEAQMKIQYDLEAEAKQIGDAVATLEQAEAIEAARAGALEDAADSIGFVKLTDKLKRDATTMIRREARFVVDAYWDTMRKRVAASNQISAFNRCDKCYKKREDCECPDKAGAAEPHGVITWIRDNTVTQEKWINTVIKEYAESQPMGRWAMKHLGIKHGIAAALLAYIDPEKAETSGDVWSIFGINPQQVWLGREKAEKWVAAQKGTPEEILARAAEEFHRKHKTMLNYATTDAKRKKIKLTRERIVLTLALRPWNAKLKTIAFHIGACLMRVKNKPNASFYSGLYDERKAYEVARNKKGVYASQAAAIIERTPNHKMRAIYKKGMLPPGHIHARCLRYVAKWFLADYQQGLYFQFHGKPAPKPYAIAKLGHAHFRPNPDAGYSKAA
jgi:hypothetical protein